jgi:hypothetical protein
MATAIAAPNCPDSRRYFECLGPLLRPCIRAIDSTTRDYVRIAAVASGERRRAFTGSRSFISLFSIKVRGEAGEV